MVDEPEPRLVSGYRSVEGEMRARGDERVGWYN